MNYKGKCYSESGSGVILTLKLGSRMGSHTPHHRNNRCGIVSIVGSAHDYGENRTATEFAANAYGPAVQFHDLPDGGQADTGPVAGLGRIEGIEYAPESFRIDTTAVVGKGQFDGIPGCMPRYVNLRRLGFFERIQAIEQEIIDDGVQLSAITLDHHLRRSLKADIDPLVA